MPPRPEQLYGQGYDSMAAGAGSHGHATQEARPLERKTCRVSPSEGEKYYRESEDDQGIFNTHDAYPNIMRCSLSTWDFQQLWDNQLADEMDALAEEIFKAVALAHVPQESDYELREKIAGQWLFIDKDQAIWRAPAGKQFGDKFPDWDWGLGSGKITRPAELIYVRQKGKLVLDGPIEVLDPLLRVLKHCHTEPDDLSILPKYDTKRMERYP